MFNILKWHHIIIFQNFLGFEDWSGKSYSFDERSDLFENEWTCIDESKGTRGQKRKGNILVGVRHGWEVPHLKNLR